MGLIKNENDIRAMAESGRIAALILKELVGAVRPGVTTRQLNELAVRRIKEEGVAPSFLNQDGFPAVLCTSVNDVIVHGVPSDVELQEGDTVGLDFGVIYEGWHSDTAVTVPVGEVSFEAKRIMDVAKRALRLGIKKARPGATTGDIGNTIQRFVEGEGYSVVRELVGHGIGRELHEDPQVPNYGRRGSGEVLKAGMVIAIEPMIIDGTADLKLAPDGFGYASPSGALTAHFEHTIVITEEGPVILTKA
ncbi:MAG: type I methionyl aminopeptidase [Candidatus Spechtbacterales bacterium]